MIECKCFACNKYSIQVETKELLQEQVKNDGGFYTDYEYTECPICHYDGLEIVQ